MAGKGREQVEAANALLAAMLRLIADLAIAGGAAIMEHPETFWREDRAAIWRLPSVLHLRRLPAVSTVHLDLCTVGLPAKGPTCLLTLRCPALRGLVEALPGRGACGHASHEQQLIGRSEGGDWRTAAKRQYTPAFSRLLAQGILGSLQRMRAGGGPAPEEEAQADASDKEAMAVFDVSLPPAGAVGLAAPTDLDAAALRARRGEGRGPGKQARLEAIAASDDFLAQVLAA